MNVRNSTGRSFTVRTKSLPLPPAGSNPSGSGSTGPSDRYAQIASACASPERASTVSTRDLPLVKTLRLLVLPQLFHQRGAQPALAVARVTGQAVEALQRHPRREGRGGGAGAVGAFRQEPAHAVTLVARQREPGCPAVRGGGEAAALL